MGEKIKHELMQVLEKCYGKNRNEPIHGIPHIERVFEGFKLFKKDNSFVSVGDIQALEYAVVLHDIGRNNPSAPEHGVESVRILDKYFQKEFPKDLPKREWICNAIGNHTKIFNFEDKTKKNFFLAYLIILDCMDTVGERGINRTIRACNIPLIPKRGDLKIERIKELLENPEDRTDEDRNMKNSSILEHLTYNYCFVKQMYGFLKDRFSLAFEKEINNRLDLSKDFIYNLLEFFKLK